MTTITKSPRTRETIQAEIKAIRAPFQGVNGHRAPILQDEIDRIYARRAAERIVELADELDALHAKQAHNG